MSIAAVTDAEFASQVLAAPTPVLVDVWAAWCQPCLTLKPVMDRLAQSYRDTVSVLTLDADTNLETVTRYDIRALPTVLLFDRGALVARHSGAQAYQTYEAMLNRQLAARAESGAGAEVVPVAVIDPATIRHAGPPDSPSMREARTLADAATPLVIFKHSATCAISLWVKRQYDAFVEANPDVPTRLVVVQQERPLSDALEELLAVQHESPQAIVVQRGAVVWHASHRRITADGISQALQSAQATA